MNTNGTGPGGGQARIRALLAHHEAIVRALQTTLELLTGEAAAKKTKRVPAVLGAALAEEAARRTKRGRPRGKRAPWPNSDQRRALRAESARILALFSATPQRQEDVGLDASRTKLQPLIRWGYLRKKGKGWVRTAKVFHP